MNARAHDLTACEARRLLGYDPKTGVFTRKVGSGRARAGDVAGRLYGNGYRYISVHNHWYREHRLAFLVMTGDWPKGEVDHVDRNPSNNRWTNLRACTHAENHQNRGVSRNNTSGFTGVVWLPKQRKWRARIKVNGKVHFLGLFADPKDAAAAYRAAKPHLHPFSNGGN